MIASFMYWVWKISFLPADNACMSSAVCAWLWVIVRRIIKTYLMCVRGIIKRRASYFLVCVFWQREAPPRNPQTPPPYDVVARRHGIGKLHGEIEHLQGSKVHEYTQLLPYDFFPGSRSVGQSLLAFIHMAIGMGYLQFTRICRVGQSVVALHAHSANMQI